MASRDLRVNRENSLVDRDILSGTISFPDELVAIKPPLVLVENRKLMGQLNAGQKGVILEVGVATACFVSEDEDHQSKIPSTGSRLEILRRLQEVGVLAGARFEVMSVSPFGKDPIAIRVRGTIFALRRSEANEVLVELDT